MLVHSKLGRLKLGRLKLEQNCEVRSMLVHSKLGPTGVHSRPDSCEERSMQEQLQAH
jgi:hypothetical protein